MSSGFDGFPFIVGWELTLACNLRCRHCGSSAKLPRLNELSLEESLRICDQMPPLLVREVDFTGGEPLLKPGWQKITARLGKLGIRTQMLTNGLALNEEFVKQMVEEGLGGVGISVDGVEQTHDRIRAHQGLFKRVLQSIELLQKTDLVLTVLTTVSDLNVNELSSIRNILESIGIVQWQIQPVFHFGRMKDAPELQLSHQTYQQLGAFIKEWTTKKDRSRLEIKLADSYGYFTDFDTRHAEWHGCPAGRVTCGITSDGKIKGCLSLPDHLIEGDLRRDDFWNIWFRTDGFSYTRNNSNNDLGPNCQSCDKADLCQGGCSAMSFGNTGIFHNDPYCFYGFQKNSPEFAAK